MQHKSNGGDIYATITGLVYLFRFWACTCALHLRFALCTCAFGFALLRNAGSASQCWFHNAGLITCWAGEIWRRKDFLLMRGRSPKYIPELIAIIAILYYSTVLDVQIGLLVWGPHLTLIDNTDNKLEAIRWEDTGSFEPKAVQIGFLRWKCNSVVAHVADGKSKSMIGKVYVFRKIRE